MKKLRTPKAISQAADVFILFAMAFGFAMIVICLYYAIVQWLVFFKPITDLPGRMFWIGLLIAIVSGISNLFERFVKQFAISYNNLANK